MGYCSNMSWYVVAVSITYTSHLICQQQKIGVFLSCFLSVLPKFSPFSGFGGHFWAKAVSSNFPWRHAALRVELPWNKRLYRLSGVSNMRRYFRPISAIVRLRYNTRNQVVSQEARGFESHRFRQQRTLICLPDRLAFFHAFWGKYNENTAKSRKSGHGAVKQTAPWPDFSHFRAKMPVKRWC